MTMLEAPGAQDDDGATGRVVARVKEGMGEEEEEGRRVWFSKGRREAQVKASQATPPCIISPALLGVPSSPDLPRHPLGLPQLPPFLSLSPPAALSCLSIHFSPLLAPRARGRSPRGRGALQPPRSTTPVPQADFSRHTTRGLGCLQLSLSPHVKLRPRPNQRPHTTAHRSIQTWPSKPPAAGLPDRSCALRVSAPVSTAPVAFALLRPLAPTARVSTLSALQQQQQCSKGPDVAFAISTARKPVP